MQRRSFLAAAASTALAVRPASAQDSEGGYPQRPVTIIVPYPPGGNADGVARVFATAFTEQTGKPVVVDNKPGASGTIGAAAVARAAGDGHTFLLTPSSQLHNTLPNVPPPYDAARDFVPIIGLTHNPLVLGVPASLGIQSVSDLGKRAQAGKLNYGSYGIGNVTHVLLHVLNQQLGGKMVHVPYRGESLLMTDLLGGQVHAGLFSPGMIREMEQTGKVRALATVGIRRSAFVPHVPTFSELGFKQLDWPFNSTIYVSSKVPTGLRARIEDLAQHAVAGKAVQDAFFKRGSEFWGGTAAQVRELIANTTQRWPQFVAGLGKIE